MHGTQFAMDGAWIGWLLVAVVVCWFVYRAIVLRSVFEPQNAAEAASGDQRVREDVNQRLMADRSLRVSAIAIDVRAGCVTLRGIVDSRGEKEHAKRVVASVPGVGSVDNQLRVSAPPLGPAT